MNDILEGLSTSGKIKAYLTVKGLTKHDLAKVLDVTYKTINNRMADDMWKTTDLKKMADLFQIDVRDLI